MIQCNRQKRVWSTSLTLVLSVLIADAAVAAPVTLQSVAVTPAARSLAVGQTQRYTATGTFTDGSTHALGAAISNIAPGTANTCVLLTRGGVNCWGYNHDGQLGDGTTTDSVVPRPVKWITTATAVAFARGEHGCALLASGAVQCWGGNGAGQLGNGTMTYSPTTRPVRVTGIDSATALSLGNAHSCALLNNGTVQCWGNGEYGQLGNGSSVGSSVPVSAMGVSTATSLASGYFHSCARLANGAVQCWGYNALGQVGDEPTTDYVTTPVTVRGADGVIAVAAGGYSSCALLASGAVKCWGWNRNGQLGDGRIRIRGSRCR